MIFLFLTLINFAFASNCIPLVSAWYDLGSGSSKVLVTESNSCTPKVYKKIFSTNLKVDYKKDLLTSSNKKFSSEIAQLGTKALKDLKAQTSIFNPTSHQGVATAAFREALNGSEIIKTIQAHTGIELKIISQQQEAELAYWASNPQSNPQHVSFDIGGGSFQITYQAETSSAPLVSIKGNIASVSFFELLKQNVYSSAQIEKKQYYLTPKQIVQARKILKKELKKTPFQTIPAKYKKHIVGIGGVFNKSIKPLLKDSNIVTRTNLDHWLLNESSTFKFTGKEFEETIISNVILISELMDYYQINKIYLSDFELAEGLFILNSNSDQRK